MKRKLGILSCILGSVLMLGSIDTQAGIILNGEILDSKVKTIQVDGTTLVSIRSLSDKLGVEVTYNPNNKKIDISKDDKNICLTLNSKNAVVNNKTIKMLQPPIIENGSAFVPIRFIAEAIGCNIVYDETIPDYITDDKILDIIKDQIHKLTWIKPFDEFEKIENANDVDILKATLSYIYMADVEIKTEKYPGQEQSPFAVIPESEIDRVAKHLFGDGVKINHPVTEINHPLFRWDDGCNKYITVDGVSFSNPTAELINCTKLNDVYNVDVAYIDYREDKKLIIPELSDYKDVIKVDSKKNVYWETPVVDWDGNNAGKVVVKSRVYSYDNDGKITMMDYKQNSDGTEWIEYARVVEDNNYDDESISYSPTWWGAECYVPSKTSDYNIHRYTLKLKDDGGIELISCKFIKGSEYDK